MTLLNLPFNTPFDSAPFSQIKVDDFNPAFEAAIAIARQEIQEIVDNPEPPSFTNTIETLEFSGRQLDRISSIFFNLNAAETNPSIQALAQEISPKLTEFANDIVLNAALFVRINAVYSGRVTLNLSIEQQELLNRKYKMFVRNGANLPESSKKRLRAIDKELSTLKLTFGEHVLAETNDFTLHIETRESLSGLPETALEIAEQLAESKGLKGWVFTLDYPSYIPFMTYADNRDLRKQMALAFGSKGFKADANDNTAIVLKISKLRHERARLLGYETHAHFVLEERMAESPVKVRDFLNDLLEKTKGPACEEFEALKHFAQEMDGIDTLEKWDAAYYSEKLKQQLFDIDDERLKPYFPLDQVIDGVFKIAERLFGLRFERVTGVDVYHEDVQTYSVTDSEGAFVALFYADFFPRSGKRNGAWMTSFKPQCILNGVNERPHVAIVCNFTKPTKTKPSLLTFNEVTTLFHEFGHALHGMLANTQYPSLSGTNVYWDFVELPSQILENWCYEPEALSLFARHYETGEPIPQDYIDKIKASYTFQSGMKTLRQLTFGLLDMAWHGIDPSAVEDVKTHELLATAETQLYPDVKENCISTAFAHIFQGGYASGYYSYKWAEVLDADAFEYFMENGIFNPEISGKFKTHILSRGGTEHPAVLYKRFRGRDPEPEALLRRSGLIQATP